MRPKLTVGMAVHTDAFGVWTTIQSMRLTNQRIRDIEFVVVNNGVGSSSPWAEAHTKDTKGVCDNIKFNSANVKYIEMTEEEGFGTTQPRERVFKEATGEYVLCVDSHVMLEAYALDRFIDWMDANPNCMDLIQGPILKDDLTVMGTDWEDEWRDEMWGIWHLDPKGLYKPDKYGSTPFNLTPQEIENLPPATRLNYTADLEPFEIQAMGLGLFGCRKEAWLGFNPHFRGFGGEEWYIHRKYRKAGRKVICLPWLRWAHWFGRPYGIAYPISRPLKVRNYILGHQELGDSLSGIHAVFVQTGKLTEQEWKWLLADPINNIPARVIPQQIRAQGQEARPNPAAPVPGVSGPTADLDDIYIKLRSVPRDLNEHMDTLREWAARCEVVTEFSERRESTVALLSGRPKKFISYNLERDIVPTLVQALQSQETAPGQERSMTIPPAVMNPPYKCPLQMTDEQKAAFVPTDLLFIDTKHNADQLSKELALFGPKVRRAIIVHDTKLYGERGDVAGSLGVNQALRDWIEEHPEWFVAFYNDNQYGLTIISKDKRDKPHKPVIAWLRGPGYELKKILHKVGINPTDNCDCNRKAQTMNEWGCDECQRRFDEIVGWMREGSGRWGWTDKLTSGFKLLMTDPILAMKLDPLDPYPGLVQVSIDRARKYEENDKAIKDKLATTGEEYEPAPK